MKVLITGGHFSPAQAVIEELKKRGVEIAVAGRRHPFEGDGAESIEYQVVRRENIKFYELKAGRFQRKFTTYSISSLLKTPGGYIAALKILRDFKPDVVLTFGGYIGLPISFAAATLGIPVVLHEQTLEAGLASKMISKIAAKVLVAFESSSHLFNKKKVVLTGNPIRAEIFKVEEKINIPQGKKVIYITGGSTGSHFINTQIAKIVDKLVQKYVVIHQTGENKFLDYENLLEVGKKLAADVRDTYILKKFVSEKEIGFILKNADLVIARSGINTVCELLIMEKISLLIPLPTGQRNEQYTNAKMVERLGVGKVLREDEIDEQKLLDTIENIFDNIQEFKKNTSEAKKIIKLGAAERVCDILQEYYGEEGN